MLLIRNSGNPSLRSYIECITKGMITGKARENIFDFVIDCKYGLELSALLSVLPACVSERYSDKCVVKIKKSDLIRHMINMRNPLRYACQDEYSAMLAMYMVLDFTSLFKSYAENLYVLDDQGFVHDRRSGAGRFQEFLNYLGDRHPGRLPQHIPNGPETYPLSFPNPELLKGELRFSNYDTNYVFSDAENAQDSVLLKAVQKRLTKLRRVDFQCVSEGKDRHHVSAVTLCMERFVNSVACGAKQRKRLEVSCVDFAVVMREIINDSDVRSFVEKELYTKQLEYAVNKMQQDFDAVKNVHIGSISTPKVVSDHDSEIVSNAINALKSFKKLIENRHFFRMFNQGKGILQAQRYFRCVRSMVDAEIVFLTRNIEKLTADDLRLFISETCKNVSHDINQLLTIYDHFVTGRTVDVDAVVRVSKSEIAELTDNVRRFVSLYEEIYYELCTGDALSLEEVSTKILHDKQAHLNSWEESLLNLDNLSRIFTVDGKGRWNVNSGSRNALLIDKIESHELCEVIHKLNCHDDNDVRGMVSDLFSGQVTNEKVFSVLKKAIKNRKHEYIVDIEYSRLIDFVKSAYEFSTYLPFCSLWLPLFSVGRYRTYSNRRGEGIKGWFSTKNSLIRHTEYSLNISKNLTLQPCEQRFVTGDCDAEMLRGAFRKRHNISGYQERFVYLLKKYRLALYVLSALVAVSSISVGILENMRANDVAIPGFSSVRGIFLVLKIIFDIAVAIIVLDTVVENFLLLIMNFLGFIVRVIDFILLGGLISRVIRFVFCKLCDVWGSICEGFIDMCFQLHTYGLRNSLFLLLDKLFNSERSDNLSNKYERGLEPCVPELNHDEMAYAHHTLDITTNFVCGDGTDMKGRENFRDIHQSADILSLYLNTSEKYNESFGKSLKRSCHIMASELYGKKAEVSQVLAAFADTISEAQSTVLHRNYIKLRQEFCTLLNSYPEELRLQIVNPNNPTIFDSHHKRREVYDLIAAVNLQTIMMAHGNVVDLSLGASARSFIENAHLTWGDNITLVEINEKIAGLQWAINSMAESGITMSIRRHEVLFHETKIERSCAIAMIDCIKILQYYREQLLEGRTVSKRVISCYIESNFYSYIRDVCSILEVMDKKRALRHGTESYRRFCEIMFEDFFLLEKESSAAGSAKNILSLDTGVMSSITKIKQAFIEFVEYFQNPKSILISFCVYRMLLIMGGRVAEYASRYASLTDNVLSAIGFDYVYEIFMQNEYSEKFLNFFWGSIFPRDMAIIVWEIMRSTLALDEDEVLSAARVMDHYIYCSSFHKQGDSLEELKSFFNEVADLFCTVTQAHLVSKIINRKGSSVHYESLEFFLQQEMEKYHLSHGAQSIKHAGKDSDFDTKIGELQCASIHSFGALAGCGI